MDMNEFLGGQWLSKTDVDARGEDLTIAAVTKETVGQELETKPCLSFRGNTKPMTLNKTNVRILIALFGPDSRDWVGRTINVYNDVTVVFNGSVGGLRIRPSQQDPAPAPRPQTSAADYKRAREYAQDQQADARTTQQQRRANFDDDIPF